VLDEELAGISGENLSGESGRTVTSRNTSVNYHKNKPSRQRKSAEVPIKNRCRSILSRKEDFVNRRKYFVRFSIDKKRKLWYNITIMQINPRKLFGSFDKLTMNWWRPAE
jgi:hypothetical protein